MKQYKITKNGQDTGLNYLYKNDAEIVLKAINSVNIADDTFTIWETSTEKENMRDLLSKVKKVNHGANGSPRYVVHFMDLGLSEYKATNKTRSAGLSIYRGQDFGGGFVFQSYNVEYDLKRIISRLKP